MDGMSWIKDEEVDTEFIRVQQNSRSMIVRLFKGDAEKLLKMNTHNRKVDDSVVLRYACDMQEGRWQYNGEPIIVSNTDVIISGQHRLLALSLCDENVSIVTLLVIGVDMKVQSTVNQGKPFSLADTLVVSDIENMDDTVAAGIRAFVLWDNGWFFADTRANRARMSRPALQKWSESHKEIIELLYEGRHFDTAPLRNGLVRAIYAKLVVDHGNKGNVDEFMGLLASGANLYEGSPILALRNRLLKIQLDKIRMSDRELIGYVVNAFNNYRKGINISRVQTPKGSWTKENFPRIINK